MKTFFISLFSLLSGVVFSQNLNWRHVNSSVTVYANIPGSTTTLFTGDVTGFIKKSEDGGATWSVVYRGEGTGINDIKFINTSDGFATCVNKGMFLETSDGGATWKQKIMLDTLGNTVNESFYSIEQINPSAFLINGTRHTGKNAFITKDNGLNYEQLSVPGTVKHVSGDTLLAFGRSGFSFGISISYDLGKNWSLVKSNPSGLGSNNFYYNGMNKVNIITSKVFFITSADGNPDGVFITNNGGVSFSMLVDPINNFFPEYIDFTDALNGVVAGRISSGFFGFYSTADGGQTWSTLLKTTLLQDKLNRPIHNVGNNTILAQRALHTVISKDGGVTFTDLSDDFALSGTYGDMSIKIAAKDKFFASAVTSSGSKFVQSDDGGLTWFTPKDAANNIIYAPVNLFIPTSKDTLFYLNGKNIKRYVSGSSIVDEIVSSYSSFSVNGTVKIIKKNNDILSLGKDFIHYSFDKGITWNNQSNSIPGNTIVDVAFNGLSAIYALTESDFFKSTDTCKSWTSIKQNMNLSTGGTNANIGVYVFNDNEIIVHGNSGRIYKTFDGGTTWDNLKDSLPSNPDLRFYNFRWMEFKNDSIGYAGDHAANGGRYVLQTTNGGKNWSVYTGGQNMIITKDMHFFDDNHAVMIGGSGPNVVKYYSDANSTIDTVVSKSTSSVTTSVSQTFDIKGAFIYPNPTNESFYIQGINAKSIIVYNVQGKMVFQKELTTNFVNLPVLSSGLYYAVISDGQKQVQESLVIE